LKANLFFAAFDEWAEIAVSFATQSFGEDGPNLLAIAIPSVRLRGPRCLLSEPLAKRWVVVELANS